MWREHVGSAAAGRMLRMELFLICGLLIAQQLPTPRSRQSRR
jgi:hypothetical protein